MYTSYRINCKPTETDQLVAFLAESDFDSFEETDHGMVAYALTRHHANNIEALEELKQHYNFTFSFLEVEEKNWNEIWESGFDPIRVGNELAIRASFHPAAPEVQYDLVIDPKMSFGTGHHATTYMMCAFLLEHFAGGRGADQRVLDYGCGTGVLGILAGILGAGTVDGVDIEPWAVENSRENAELNGVEFNRLVLGKLEEILSGKPYDVVLANINRNVLLADAEALRDNIRAGGRAYLSGILSQDEIQVIDHYSQAGFTHVRTVAREDWRALEFIRE